MSLDCGGLAKGKLPFRFENMWLKEPGFVEWVRVKWESYALEGDPCFKLAKKLKLLKEDLKVWNNEVFGRVEIKIKSIAEEIRKLDEEVRVGEGSDGQKFFGRPLNQSWVDF